MTTLALTNGAGNSSEALTYLQQQARNTVLARHEDVALSGAQLDSEILHEMLMHSVAVRAIYQAVQGQLAAHVYREHLWVHHPLYNFGDGYQGFRLFLKSTGLGESAVSELAGLGYWVVPFCDQHEIPIDHYIGPGEWGKTRDTLTALKRAVQSDSVSAVKAIFNAIDDTAGSTITSARLALRAKYRTRQAGDRPGRGTTMQLDDGRYVLIVTFSEEDDLRNAVSRVGCLTDWTLWVRTSDGRIVIE